MISGALFLDNAYPFSAAKHCRKMLRIICAFIFWSAFYAIDQMILGGNYKAAVTSFIVGKYHLYFLYIIFGLCLTTPILRKITESKKITEYFLILGFIFNYLIPNIIRFLQVLELPHTERLINAVNTAFSSMGFHLTLGAAFWFVLGFYLSKYEFSLVLRRAGYGLGIAGYIGTAFLTYWFSAKMGAARPDYLSTGSLNVLLMAMGIFIFAKYVLSNIKLNDSAIKRLRSISKYTFGVYLVHPFVIEKLNDWFNLNTLTFNPIISMCVIVFVALVVSLFISAIINRIPILKKYVV